MRVLCLLITFLTVYGQSEKGFDQSSIYYTEPTFINVSNNSNGGLTELHGSHIVRGQRLLERSKSPYLVREDLFVERESELVIEPGVEIRFGPMVGITVRGIIIAKVMPQKSKATFIPRNITKNTLDGRDMFVLTDLVIFSIKVTDGVERILDERNRKRR